MSIPELSVKRPVFVSCLFILILALGALARSRLPTSLYPDVAFPVVNVTVPFPGAAPEEVESQVAKPLETALGSLSGIRTVRSLNLDGAAVVTAVFTMNTDIRFAEQKVIQTVARVRGELPSGILEPSVKSVDPSDTPVLTLSLKADLPEAALRDLADRELVPLLEQVAGVGQVEVLGARRREIQVNLDANRLRAHEMSAQEVVGRLSGAGLNIPAGEVQDPRRQTLFRTVGQFDSLDAIRKVPIRFVGNEAATLLSGVADVTDGLEDERSRVYVDGVRALTLRVFRQSGSNTVAVSDALKEQVAKIGEEFARKQKGFELAVLRDGAAPVREGVRDANEAIVFGVILTVAVVFFFLGSLRSTIITGLALPNSLLGAFLLMSMAGFSVNITTLAALALAVGLLIDDAIVVRENIFRRIQEGESPRVAAVAGTREVTLAVVATTLTVLSVFGPVSFLKGLIGQFFKEFGLTICFAMLISLLDSLTIAPMLSAYFAGRQKTRKPGAGERLFRSMDRGYHRILKFSLARPLAVLGLAALIFGLSFVVLAWIPKSFVPSQESGEFQVALDLPAGTSLEAMDQVARQVDSKLHARGEIARTVVTVGGEHGEKNQASILVLLKPSRERSLSTNGVKELVREDLMTFPQAASRVEDLLDIGGGAGQPFVMNVTGEDLEALKKVSAALVERLKKSPELKDVDRSFRSGASELRWVIDPERAREFGISSGQVGQELRLFVAGATPARFHEGGKEYDVRVRLKPEQRDLSRTFPLLAVPNLNHRLIPLSSVAGRAEAESPASIQRQDRKRFIEITAGLNPRGRGLALALEETRRLLTPGTPDGVALPPGVSYEFAGQTKDFQDLLTSVIVAVALSVGFMYLVLASLYESFFIPLSIMLVLPLAVCGAFYALGVTGSSLDIYSCVGCVLLLGVAAKNSILLVDHIHEGVREGKDLRTAILRAGEVRLRPILMTSFALIAGMLPMALPLQEAAKSRAPMAIAVIGGVVSSTLLTLVVVPAAYRYILALQRWVLAAFRMPHSS